MLVETNVRLAKRNRQIAQYLFFFSFGLLILGLFVTNTQTAPDSSPLAVILPALVLPVAFACTLFSVRMTNLWVRPPRPETLIRENLKGLSNKSVLYNYYHFPARHVLICPQGVFAMVTRFQDGRFTVEGDRWTTHRSFASRLFSIFRLDGIGNPTHDAQRAAAHVKSLLAEIAPDIEVQPLIIFVDPRATVEQLNPTVPVLYVNGAKDKREPNLKDYMRDANKVKRKTLTQEQIDAFNRATLPAAR